MQIRLLSILLTILVSACASRVESDKKIVSLLPESAAKKIIEDKIGMEWLKNPYIEKSWSCTGGKKEYISLKDIKGLTFNPLVGRLFVFKEKSEVGGPFRTCNQWISFPLDKVSATEVTTALKSLGACTHPQSFAC